MFQPGNIYRSLTFLLFWGLAVLPARAAELEAAQTLEGFPFSGAASVAMTADGRNLYAGGSTDNSRVATPGLAWLRRDPFTGKLQFRRNYLSTGASASVLGAALSRYDGFLYVLLKKELVYFRRELDGSLVEPGPLALPSLFQPETLFLTPDGGQLVVLGRVNGVSNQALFYHLAANGLPSLEQTLSASLSRTSLLALDDDLLVCGRVLLRRVGQSWTAETIEGLASLPGAFFSLVSPDKRYLYARASTGTFPHTHSWILSFEKVGGAWVEAGRSEVDYDFERAQTALAIHPQSGDIYLASYDTNGGAQARIDHYRSLEGGRIFAQAVRFYDVSREINVKTAKHSLFFAADGRQLYTTFGGEPMALLEVDPVDGSLSYLPRAAGLHSHFERPFKILAKTSGDTYLVTPNAILQTAWTATGVELRSSLDVESWTAASSRQPFTDLVLTPVGGAGVVSNGQDLAFVERDPASGALRILNETSLRPPSGASRLEISPDGRYVYAPVFSRIFVYYLRRDVPKLVLAQEFPLGGSKLRISPDGRDAVMIGDFGTLVFLRRDITSGELILDAGPARSGINDVFFTADGQLALWRFAASSSSATLELLRHSNGQWDNVLQGTFGSASEARQIFDSQTHFYFQLADGKLEQFAATPQLGTFSRLARLSGEALDAVAQAAPIRYQNEVSTLALLPGEERLLVANAYSGNVQLFRRGCGALASGPCLGGGRFRVELEWRAGNASGPGLPLTIGSADSQLFSFFDTSNWEVLVKVLDGCGINGKFWVYAAASTDLAYDLIVSDTWTGQRSVYHNAAGVPAPAITDAAAFATCDAVSPGWNPPLLSREPLYQRPAELQLASGFKATVRWRTQAGLEGSGTGLETVPRQASGLFYFFDSSNWEMLVKVLDGCAINGHRWVFAAATTDVGYTLEVEESATGRRKTYTNPVGQPSRATTDIRAFSCN